MDIGGTWWKGGKGKGQRNKGKGKGDNNKGKGYGGYGQQQQKGNGYNKGKGKGKSKQPIGQGNPFKGNGKPTYGYNNWKGYGNYGKSKGKGKGKAANNVCYRRGQAGHIAKHCRVTIYNVDGGAQETADPTVNWCSEQQQYWWNADLTAQYPQQTQQLALPAPQQGTTDFCNTPLVVSGLVGTVNNNNEINNDGYNKLVLDSGAATHVCPHWFGQEFPLQHLDQHSGPRLRTVTNQEINVYGYRWIKFVNEQNQPIVIPFYVCDVEQPIVSVTRLIDQGFNVNFNENPTIHHDKGFDSHLQRLHGLFYLNVVIDPLPAGTQDTPTGRIAVIAPTTLTPTQQRRIPRKSPQASSQGALHT